jgi:hypothetical protein
MRARSHQRRLHELDADLVLGFYPRHIDEIDN